MASKMNHPRRIPVSSRYEFIMSPILLFSDTKRLRKSDGNPIDHTIGGKWCVPLVHTHPAPSDDASVNPMYYGSPGTSSYMLVGRWDMLISSVSQSSSVSASSEFGLMLIVLGVF